MKTTMKKIAAYLLAILLVLQMIPALAEDTVVSKPQGPITSYRDKLTISSDTSTLSVGMTIRLTVSDNFDAVKWKSSDKEVATVDQDGNVTGVAPGQVKITATDSGHSDSITLRVVENTNSQGKKRSDGTMMVFITGEKTKVTYDGKEHTLGYSATGDSEDFDESKLHMINPAKLVSGKDCNVYTQEMTKDDFEYEGEEVEFVITNGWLQIKPAQITLIVNDATVNDGEQNPEFSAEAVGLIGEDTLDLSGVEYTVTEDGKITPNIEAGAIIGNYRVQTIMAGKLTVKQLKEYPLYNIAQIENNKGAYYRLRKTTIRTDIDLDEYVSDLAKDGYAHILNESQYSADDYDFANEIVTYKNKTYAYITRINDDLNVDGYYTIELKDGEEVTAVKNKIGATSGWLFTDNHYTDDNKTNSFHRNYYIHFKEKAQAAALFKTQDLYNMLSIDGNSNYYRLKKSTVDAIANMADLNAGTTLKTGEYNMTKYDFTNLVITVDGVDYHYYTEAPEDDSVSYYTVQFEKVIKENRFNNKESWYLDSTGFLDNSEGDYAELPNETQGFHANYKATLHKGTGPRKDATISSSWPAGKVAYPGAKITLTATLTGFDAGYHIQWQYSTDTETWYDQPGANDLTYTYTLDETTARYYWRVSVE